MMLPPKYTPRPPGLLPDKYELVLDWKVEEKLLSVIFLQILSIPLFVISGLGFWGLAINLGMLPLQLEFRLGQIGVIFAAIVLTIILHEAAHGIAMRIFGASPQYGVLWKKLMFYATSPGFAYRRNAYIWVALVPLWILSVLMIVGMWIASGTFWVAVFVLCAAMNVGGAVGDIWMTFIVLRYPPSAFVTDERDGICVYLPMRRIE